MRATVILDDKLLAEARKYTGIEETSPLIHEALQHLVQREAARRLILLGGTMPEFPDIPRRRSGDE